MPSDVILVNSHAKYGGYDNKCVATVYSNFRCNLGVTHEATIAVGQSNGLARYPGIHTLMSNRIFALR